MNLQRRPIARESGFSLIELLVAMVIGLIVTLAITSVLIRSEGFKRTNTSVNEVDQTGVYAAFLLDRAIRSAGSGFSQSWSTVYGCRLDVAQGSTKVLPIPASTMSNASAFAGMTASSTAVPIRMAPVVIASGLAGTGGDILMVMGGTGGAGEAQQEVKPGSTATAFVLRSALGFGTNDLVLLADSSIPAGCMMEQVGTRTATTAGTDLPWATSGTYYATTGTNVNLVDFTGQPSTIALKLGNTANLPQLQLYGVGTNNTLFSLDLLRPLVSSVVSDIPIADGVVEMRAVYGLDTDTQPDGKIDGWKDPSEAGYTASALMDGSTISRSRLRQISAIRIGLILRTALQEKEPVIGPADPTTRLGTMPLTLTLFGDLPVAVQHTRTFAAGTLDLNYRYRTIELTIPLRNVLIAPPV